MTDFEYEMFTRILKFHREGKIMPLDIPPIRNAEDKRHFYYLSESEWINNEYKDIVAEGDLERIKSLYDMKMGFYTPNYAWRDLDYSYVNTKLKEEIDIIVGSILDKY